ncbi:MAG: LUD domain-containing protein [Syntrophaceticus schinkii]|nr:LUD domain-containing protein [Syntrophaceticus schinkii]
MNTFRSVGAELIEITGEKELTEALLNLIAVEDAQEITVGSIDIYRKLKNKVPLRLLSANDDITQIKVGLGKAAFGILETGSIVENEIEYFTRVISMLADTYIVLLNRKDLLFSLEDAVSIISRDISTYISFVTGPSRTADIERVLTIGVHGPKKMYILLTEEEFLNRGQS